ncbi:MAG: hypothetical protein DWQ02_25680 [Bacteroidetes bacterium]|nr:MAG: hypothetical protein DWQ02_25680 [Bacteroidota bacterium]
MKKLGLVIISLLLNLSAIQSQDVSFKKGFIRIDKEEKFELVKIKKEGLLPFRSFTLKNMKGENLLYIMDTSFYFQQLPCETKPRLSFGAYAIISTELNQTTIVPHFGALNFGKRLAKDLEAAGFFKDEKFTEPVYEKYLEILNVEEGKNLILFRDTTDINREKNYELTKEQFGELYKRQPGKIKVAEGKITDGIKEVGKFKMKSKGSYSHVYEIINKEGYTIAKANLFQTDNRGNVKPVVANEFKWFNYKKDKDGVEPSVDSKLTQIAKYLIEAGLL